MPFSVEASPFTGLGETSCLPAAALWECLPPRLQQHHSQQRVGHGRHHPGLDRLYPGPGR